MSTDLFMALKDGMRFKIQGESKDDLYTGWIELLSFDIDTDFDASQVLRQLGSVKNRARTFGQLLAGGAGPTAPMAETAPVEEQEKPLEVFYFKVTKYVDRSSPFLFVNYCESASKEPVKIPKALVAIRKSGRDANSEGLRRYGMAYLKYEFANCWVVQYSIDHDATMNMPKETIRFCCSSYHMSYTPQTSAGEKDSRVRELGWDFANPPRS